MFIVRYKNFFLWFTIALIIAAAAAVALFGLKQGIDFAGGTAVEIEYPLGKRPDIADIKKALETLNLGQTVVQLVDENGLLVRARTITEEEHVKFADLLSLKGTLAIEEKQFSSIGPVIGAELKRKSFYGITLVIVLIVAYITFAFRRVSRPVASWKYGLIAIVTLVHDVIVPSGFYAVYGHYVGAEVDVLFVTALLAILGFSVHDTIVVFDRIRENLKHASSKEPFSETVGKSLNQTFTRSINTSLTVLLTLVALYFFGGDSTKNFALTLLVGIIAGTYSSIFFASPLLVEFERWQKR